MRIAVFGRSRRASSAARSPSSVKVGGSRTSTIAMSGSLELHRVHERVAVVDGRHDLEAVVAQQAHEPVPQEGEILGDHDAQGSTASTIVRPTGRALDAERPVERLDAAAQPAQARSVRIGAAAAVVEHGDDDRVAHADDPDVDARRAAVLGRVRERLGGDEVRRRLDRRGRPLGQLDVDVDRERAAARRGRRAPRRGRDR